MHSQMDAIGVDTETTRHNREDLAARARPQEGVDLLRGEFKEPTEAIPGVVDKSDGRSAHSHSRDELGISEER